MKLTIERDALAAALSFVARMTPRRPSQPILSGVLLRAGSGKLTITIYDYEVAAETVVEASITTEGVALVHASSFAQIAGKLPRADVRLEIVDSRLEVRCGAVRAAIALMPAEKYPQPSFESSPLFAMSGAVFEDAVQRVALAAPASAPEKPIIMGVHFEVNGDGVTLAATDRYRVALMRLACETVTSTEVTIPAVVLREAAKVFGSSERVEVGVTERGSITIRGDRGVMLSLVLADDFPPVERLFPATAAATAIVEVNVATEAVARAALAVEGDSAITFTFSPGECRLDSQGAGKGISEVFEIDFDGDESTTMLVPQRVLDGLLACRAPRVELWQTKPRTGTAKSAPMMFTANDGFRYLLQPVTATAKAVRA